jgi:hypothetical protein
MVVAVSVAEAIWLGFLAWLALLMTGGRPAFDGRAA